MADVKPSILGQDHCDNNTQGTACCADDACKQVILLNDLVASIGVPVCNSPRHEEVGADLEEVTSVSAEAEALEEDSCTSEDSALPITLLEHEVICKIVSESAKLITDMTKVPAILKHCREMSLTKLQCALGNVLTR